MQRMGKAFIKMDGDPLETMEGAKLKLGGTVRNTVTGSNEVLGFSEAPEPAELECQISLAKGIKLDDFRNASEVTITFQADSGQTYIMRKAWLTETPEITQGEGGPVDLKFNSAKAEEVT